MARRGRCDLGVVDWMNRNNVYAYMFAYVLAMHYTNNIWHERKREKEKGISSCIFISPTRCTSVLSLIKCTKWPLVHFRRILYFNTRESRYYLSVKMSFLMWSTSCPFFNAFLFSTPRYVAVFAREGTRLLWNNSPIYLPHSLQFTSVEIY